MHAYIADRKASSGMMLLLLPGRVFFVKARQLKQVSSTAPLLPYSTLLYSTLLYPTLLYSTLLYPTHVPGSYDPAGLQRELAGRRAVATERHTDQQAHDGASPAGGLHQSSQQMLTIDR